VLRVEFLHFQAKGASLSGLSTRLAALPGDVLQMGQTGMKYYAQLNTILI